MSRRPRLSTKDLTARLVALAATAAIAIGGLIAGRMAAGEDPALGSKPAVRHVAVLRSDDDDTPPASGYGYSNQSSVTSSPAPVVTRTS